MEVKVGDKIFSSKDQPIMVILTNDDKENIANMDPDCRKYATFQDDWGSPQEMYAWMDTPTCVDVPLHDDFCGTKQGRACNCPAAAFDNDADGDKQ